MYLDIDSAIKYASFRHRLFHSGGSMEKTYPSIYIREGTYIINKPILIDIDLNISGCGMSTIIKRGDDLKVGSTINPHTGGTNLNIMKSIFIIGGGLDTKSDKIIKGLNFKNFSYETNDSFSGIAPVFCITQDLNESGDTSYFRFENIYFQGPTNLSRGATPLYEIPVVATQSSSGDYPTSNVFGNIVMTGCYFNFMGGEDGIINVIVDDSSGTSNKVQNIICTNNIAENCSPDGIISPSQIIYDNYSSYVLLSNLIESSNAVND